MEIPHMRLGCEDPFVASLKVGYQATSFYHSFAGFNTVSKAVVTAMMRVCDMQMQVGCKACRT
jgi:hypothetical protein